MNARPSRKNPARALDLGGIRADAILPLPVVRQRLGLGNRGISAARKAGLKIIRFGHYGYCLGADVLDFFARLGRDQGAGDQGDGNGGPTP